MLGFKIACGVFLFLVVLSLGSCVVCGLLLGGVASVARVKGRDVIGKALEKTAQEAEGRQIGQSKTDRSEPQPFPTPQERGILEVRMLSMKADAYGACDIAIEIHNASKMTIDALSLKVNFYRIPGGEGYLAQDGFFVMGLAPGARNVQTGSVKLSSPSVVGWWIPQIDTLSLPGSKDGKLLFDVKAVQ